MPIKPFAKRLVHKAGFEIKRRSSTRPLDQLSVALDLSAGDTRHATVGTFADENRIEYPIYDGYRYSVKPGWLAIPSLRGLRRVQDQAGLSVEQEKQFRDIIGSRTITASIQEIGAFANSILADHADLFESEDIERCAPRLTDQEYMQSIDGYAHQISKDLASTPKVTGQAGLRVLDIGCGRGFSTAAFARLGHDALGVDSDYDGGENASASAMMRRRVEQLLSRDGLFINADITRCPEIPADSRDLIYSVSCLEHVADIGAAVREMFRILRSGGRVLHRYNPFWAENGGHAFGILDAPWLHAMLSLQDFERYLLEWRKHEAEISLPWTRTALNRRVTIASMQRALSAAGFNIETWRETIRSPDDVAKLHPEILVRAQGQYPDVQLADLLATDIVFSAVKPLGRQ